MNFQESTSINNSSQSFYGSANLSIFTANDINAKKEKLKKALSFKKECLSIAMFLTHRGLSFTAALSCFASLMLAIPALISLLVVKVYTPTSITLGDITLVPTTQDFQDKRQRDVLYLWVALGLILAASVALVLYCAGAHLHGRLRDRKIQVQDYLKFLNEVPDLKPDDEAGIIANARAMLDNIEARLAMPELNTSSPLLISSPSASV